uniref:Uncharacterized protein n=1 Tax=Setaria italica TaxID=4555 RepID=K3XUP2_SETIT
MIDAFSLLIIWCITAQLSNLVDTRLNLIAF